MAKTTVNPHQQIVKGAGWVITQSTEMRRTAITDRRQCILRRMRSYAFDAPSGPV